MIRTLIKRSKKFNTNRYHFLQGTKQTNKQIHQNSFMYQKDYNQYLFIAFGQNIDFIQSHLDVLWLSVIISDTNISDVENDASDSRSSCFKIDSEIKTFDTSVTEVIHIVNCYISKKYWKVIKLLTSCLNDRWLVGTFFLHPGQVRTAECCSSANQVNSVT